jgi:hypothetical protein
MKRLLSIAFTSVAALTAVVPTAEASQGCGLGFHRGHYGAVIRTVHLVAVSSSRLGHESESSTRDGATGTVTAIGHIVRRCTADGATTDLCSAGQFRLTRS